MMTNARQPVNASGNHDVRGAARRSGQKMLRWLPPLPPPPIMSVHDAHGRAHAARVRGAVSAAEEDGKAV
jgi:hypothetical protein